MPLTLDPGLDRHGFQRLDDAAVVAFLTSTASVLSAHGLIQSKDTDELRVVLSGAATASRADPTPQRSEIPGRSLMLELSEQHAPFLALLEARYGLVGLGLNLTRFTLRSPLVETKTVLHTLGQALLKRAELFFNRPFAIYRGGRCVRQTLFSAVLVDYAEHLAKASQLLDAALAELSLMHPSDLVELGAGEHDVDLEIAASLGFTGLVTAAMPLWSDREVQRQVAQCAVLIAEGTAQLSEQLAANASGHQAYALVAASEWLRAESQRLTLLDYPRSDNLIAWEVHRHHVSAAIRAVHSGVEQLGEALLRALAPEQTRHGPHHQPRIPDTTARRLAFDLITGGTQPAKATAAADALLDFMQRQGLAPREILAAELPRIHPSLTHRSLTTLATLTDDAATMPLANAEKTATMARVRRLGVFFAALAAMVVTLHGCGLKTAPHSDVLEARPDVPYRAPELTKSVDSKVPAKETEGAQPPRGGRADVSEPKQ